jgi:dimethylargininase
MTLAQHRSYIDALRQCGLEIIVLDADERFPDAPFVEDTAVLGRDFAVITNPAPASRNGEQETVRREVEKYYREIETILSPGTLEGGDVLEVDTHYFIGITQRTNLQGAEQFIKILNRYGCTGSMVELHNYLHLKTGVAYLGDGNILAGSELIDNENFQPFHITPVDDAEAYAANAIRVNDHVIMPSGYPRTREKVEHLGYRIIEVDVSEFRKMDGGLSCLSLRF